MRKLLLQMQTSLDGFVADKAGDTSWMQWSWGPEWTWPAGLQQYHTETVSSADEVLLSDVLARQGFIDHWASVARKSNDPQAVFASALTKAHKTIFSRSLTSLPWSNADLAVHDLAREVTHLKEAPGKNIIAFGGVRFATSLLKEGLVDELHLIVNPVAIGEGLAILNIGKPFSLSLISIARFGDMVVLQYKPIFEPTA